MTPTFLCALILNSEKPDRLVAFYRETLGLPMRRRGDTEEFSCMLGTTHFAIHKLKEGKGSSRGAEIGLHFPNLDELVRELESKKVEIVSPIKEYPWARSAEIRDPEGNTIYLMQIPEPALERLGNGVVRE